MASGVAPVVDGDDACVACVWVQKLLQTLHIRRVVVAEACEFTD